MNPMMIMMQMQSAWKKFNGNHPKFSLFLRDVLSTGMRDDTVITIQVKTPEGKVLETNMKIKPDDIELFNSLKDIAGNR